MRTNTGRGQTILPSLYFVVLEQKTGRTPGVRTWTNFGTKEKFDEAFQDDSFWDENYKIVAEGVSDDEAVNLCQAVHPVILFAAALASMSVHC